MRLALNRARRGIHETEVLRFLEWFDKNVTAVVAKKRERAHLDRINEIRDEHAPRIAFGPIPRQFVNPDLEASTLDTTIEDDGKHVQVDLCYACFKEILGPYWRVKSDSIGEPGDIGSTKSMQKN